MHRFLGDDDTYYPLEDFRIPDDPLSVLNEMVSARYSKKKTKTLHKAYKSVYELTLTTTKDDPYELRQFVKKISESSIYDVIDMPYCIELTTNGLPHVHAVLYSKKKYCDASKIKVLGFPYRYELKRVKNLDKYLIYIKKEKDNPTIIDYCTRKGIPQFDNAVQT